MSIDEVNEHLFNYAELSPGLQQYFKNHPEERVKYNWARHIPKADIDHRIAQASLLASLAACMTALTAWQDVLARQLHGQESIEGARRCEEVGNTLADVMAIVSRGVSDGDE